MARVLLTAEIDPAGMDLLRGHEILVHAGDLPIALLPERARGCAGLITMPTERVDRAVLATPGLRVVAQHAVGTDNIDLSAAAELGVIICHTPGVLTDATADLTLALLLGLARRLREGDHLVRSGQFKGWRPTLLCGLELRGARLGIVGMGRIGTAVAERARAFGMEVAHHSRGRGLSLEELLVTSDIVSLHCPLTPETRHLIDAVALAWMKPGALLINTARGPVVDEGALVYALESGWLGGAALDVYEREPAVHPGLAALDNVLLAPHLGSATVAARRRMAEMAAGDLVRVLSGEAPRFPVPSGGGKGP